MDIETQMRIPPPIQSDGIMIQYYNANEYCTIMDSGHVCVRRRVVKKVNDTMLIVGYLTSAITGITLGYWILQWM
jgi:hypothetical protein